MDAFFITLIAAIAVGSTYALLALGYTLVFGVLKFINFAHSDIFVLGAWTSFSVATVLLGLLQVSPEQAPWWAGVCVLLSAIAVCGLVGYCVERFAYRPLRKSPRLNVLITAIGVSLLLQNVGQLKLASPVVLARDSTGSPLATVPFGATPKSMPVLLPDAVLNEITVVSGKLEGGSKRGQVKLDQAVTLEEGKDYRLAVERLIDGKRERESLAVISPAGSYAPGQDLATRPKRNPEEIQGASFSMLRAPGVPIRLLDILIVVSALALMVGLELLVYRTRLGTAMRAISFNVDTAQLMGINVNLVISFTFVLGTVLAAAAGFLYPMKYTGLNQPAHSIWVLLGLKAFVAAVVGGIGNIRGAVLGGFLIAGVEFFGAFYIDPKVTDVMVFGVLIAVLLVRPSGILGVPVREKV